MPGFSATCMAAARASWFALPVTKVSKVNVAVEPRALRRVAGASARALAGRGRGLAPGASAPRASTSRRPTSRPPASAASRSMRAANRSRTRSSTNRLGAARTSVSPVARFGHQRADPGIELLRGELLLKPPQARVPEVLHLVIGLS